MLFFFFIGARIRKLLGTFPSTNAKCPSCNEKAFLKISIFQSYMRFYFIPTFPIKKVARANCSNCGYDEKIKRKSEQLKREVYFLKDKVKTPIWTWTGSVIFLVLLGLLINILIKNSSREELLVMSPKTSDVYFFLDDEELYTSSIIVKLSSDSIWFVPNINKIDILEGVEEEELGYHFDYTDTLTYSRIEILESYGKRKFKRVKRR